METMIRMRGWGGRAGLHFPEDLAPRLPLFPKGGKMILQPFVSLLESRPHELKLESKLKMPKSWIWSHHNCNCLSEGRTFQTSKMIFAFRMLPGNEAPFIFLCSHAESQSDFSDKQILCHLYIAWKSHLYGLMSHLHQRNRQPDSESCRYVAVCDFKIRLSVPVKVSFGFSLSLIKH